eukprot:TRINITY_DN6015_c0_g1_i1.p1 TRINITY_DN6015_c0_g1~~TRINITY_DN6015_c0_g1_i1.p1  ORF type:complete len:302 (+),score=52.88 TRINITY_DN6015_c0_g1_i1:224-1129(+)
MDVTDCRTLLTTDAQLEAAKVLIEKYNAGEKLEGVSEEDLWGAAKTCNAILHPQSGDVILSPLRFSAFVPMNIIICAGLLIPNPAMTTLIFWQWINQTYNIAVNYANRNTSNEMTHQQIGTSYATAVGVSCSVAIGLGLVSKRVTGMGPKVKKVLDMFIPYCAVASAGALNVFLMRKNELSEGIDVDDDEGNTLGKSPTAGKMAVTQVAISRVVTAGPTLFATPIIMGFLEKWSVMKRNPRLYLPAQLAVIGVCMLSALPACIGIFPQVCDVSLDELEPEFHNIYNGAGTKITNGRYNRGL